MEETRSDEVMHAFDINPDIRFETQQENERIVLLLRAHPITQLPWIVNTIALFIIMIILNFFLPIFLNVNQIIFFNIFGVISLFSYVWFNFLNWFFNVGIITTSRIVDIDFHNVLYKEVTESKLNKIEDITARAGGYFKSLFNYGDVFIQTAGSEVNIEFHNIPRPSRVVQIINSLHQS